MLLFHAELRQSGRPASFLSFFTVGNKSFKKGGVARSDKQNGQTERETSTIHMQNSESNADSTLTVEDQLARFPSLSLRALARSSVHLFKAGNLKIHNLSLRRGGRGRRAGGHVPCVLVLARSVDVK